jgi:hypothetical protein
MGCGSSVCPQTPRDSAPTSSSSCLTQDVLDRRNAVYLIASARTETADTLIDAWLRALPIPEWWLDLKSIHEHYRSLSASWDVITADLDPNDENYRVPQSEWEQYEDLLEGYSCVSSVASVSN